MQADPELLFTDTEVQIDGKSDGWLIGACKVHTLPRSLRRELRGALVATRLHLAAAFILRPMVPAGASSARAHCLFFHCRRRHCLEDAWERRRQRSHDGICLANLVRSRLQYSAGLKRHQSQVESQHWQGLDKGSGRPDIHHTLSLRLSSVRCPSDPPSPSFRQGRREEQSSKANGQEAKEETE